MSHPTMLSPWFIVQRVRVDKEIDASYVEYWTSDGEGTLAWSRNPHQAMLFMGLQSAARVAEAEVAEVRVLYNKDGLREFRPREFN
jgi:hypothetical protein